MKKGWNKKLGLWIVLISLPLIHFGAGGVRPALASTTVDTFESETVGTVPAGYTLTGSDANAGAVVSNTYAYGGAKSLRVYDQSASSMGSIVKTMDPVSSIILEFKIYPESVSAGAQFSLLSNGNTYNDAVFHMSILSDGMLKYYNGSWIDLSGAGNAALHQWNTIRVEAATTTSAKVYLNGNLAGEVPNYLNASTMDRIRFSSGSTVGTGDDFYVDNVSIIPTAEIVEISEVWGQDEHEGHNGFTDLIRYKNMWYLTFREGTTHSNAAGGRVRVVASDDGVNWTSVALFASSTQDVREFKFTITPDNRLLLIGAATKLSNLERQSYVYQTTDGLNFDGPYQVGDLNVWMWRVSWYQNTAYSFGYHTGLPRFIRLYKSNDGLDWDTHVSQAYTTGYPNETASVILEDGKFITLVRRDSSSPTAQLGISYPPYTTWTWQDTGIRIGGPQMIRLPGGRILALVRHVESSGNSVSLFWVDPDTAKMTKFLVLADGFDSGYAGAVFHNGLLWVSYYNSVDGTSTDFTNVYLAKIKLNLNEIPGGYVDTFESDAVDATPAGYTIANSGANAKALVSGTQAYGGTKSLKLYDQSASSNIAIVKTTKMTSAKTLEFQIYPVSVSGGHMFSLNSGGDGSDKSVFLAGIFGGGVLRYFNGSVWVTLSGAGNVPFGQWSTIRLEAGNTASARLYLNGILAGEVDHYFTSSTIDRVRFASRLITATGDEFYIDDVTIVE